MARDRPTLKIPRRDFDTKRGRDRGRPGHPLKLCSVHGDKLITADQTDALARSAAFDEAVAGLSDLGVSDV